MRLHRCRTLFAVGLSTLFVAPLAPAQTEMLVLQPTKDNTLYENAAGSVSNGQGKQIFGGRTAQQSDSLRRALLYFDVAANLPAGATINNATLVLTLTRTQAGPEPVSLHRALADWGEGASSANGQEGQGDNAEAGDATWLHRFYPSQFWTTPGGDLDPVASATTAVGSTEGMYSWTSAQLTADVQTWLNNPASNFGWVVVGNESNIATAKRFASSENNDSGKRPMLVITYTPPAASGACCFADGSCLVLTSGECATQGGMYQGDGTSCTPNPCPQPVGACCLPDGSCDELTEAQCLAASGFFAGPNTNCLDTFCPLVPFVDPLPLPAVAQPVMGTIGGEATYDIAVQEVQQQLHRDLPPTTVWGYNGLYPGPTIEATRDLPITVNWINDLRDEMGNLRTSHYLPVDTCPHGPNMAGDSPRTVTHLHGGHVPWLVDGYPEFTFLPGEQETYVYPNNQQAGTLWYHDHALGITRLNVYMGMAGFYLVRDAEENALNLPSGEFEAPLAIQDRSFNPDGSLQYPAAWQDHFFGDTILVNGKVWPFFEVKQGKYRFRMLNGSNSRTYTLTLSNGAPFTQIGTDGGLIETPVVVNELTFGPGERADVIIDFENELPGTEIILTNSAVAPFPIGGPETVIPNIMKFIVTAESGFTDPIPGALTTIPEPDLQAVTLERDFELRLFSEDCAGSTWLINGLLWDDVTEFPVLGETEVWSFINRSAVMHPMHMHLVFFQVLERQAFDVGPGGEIIPVGDPIPPDDNERGWKDTERVNPGEITRVIATFEDYTGKYAYHCHILEHEDHEMMRQFEVVAPPCVGDLTGDGAVNGADLANLLSVWGTANEAADLNGDGVVNGADLANLLSVWGPCP